MKILTLDIETSPHDGKVWGKYEQNVLWFTKYGGIISIAWKWKEQKRTYVKALPDYKGYKVGEEDDRGLLIDFCKVIEDADIIVYQNGDRFDLPMINTRLLFHRLSPLRPRNAYNSIDTLKIFRKHFKFPANNLDEVCAYLGIGRKLRTDKHLWKDCLDEKLPLPERMAAWRKMKAYNAHDVDLTQEVCERVLPYTTLIPNANLYNNTLIRCVNPMCSGPGTNLIKRGTHPSSRVGEIQAFQCKDCGKYTQRPVTSRNLLLR